jgi:PhnB protein
MNKLELAPYLFFKGNCKEAMEFYQKVFGGELTVQTMAEVPAEALRPDSKPTDVMHARLEGPVIIMASDSPQASDKTAKVELSLSGTDETTLRKIFEALSEGVTVKTPLKKQFWGDTFGQLTDKYNVDWMMNITAPK